MLNHRQQIGEDLGGVKLIGQAVPHRHAGVAGKFFNRGLSKAAVLDPVVHAAQHASGILHRLLGADLRAFGA